MTQFFFSFSFSFFFPIDIRPVASFCTQLEGISMVPLQVAREPKSESVSLVFFVFPADVGLETF